MRLRKSCPVIITGAGNGRAHTGWLTEIHHIVSTAVPALVAEPAIDILLQVESLAALDSVNDKMHDMRSTPRGENGITGRRVTAASAQCIYCSK
ncbi:hypothetical protein F0335_12020 [Serratia marcescens]|uniref:GrpB family protein n=1 Tax=Serratia marcescens TaxID=615 RepID=UPI0011F12B94|nr:GrpB family protein [Serratia marcescens]QKO39202.1 hypothetical protein F0335_12020 [Serratia marcescens]